MQDHVAISRHSQVMKMQNSMIAGRILLQNPGAAPLRDLYGGFSSAMRADWAFWLQAHTQQGCNRGQLCATFFQSCHTGI